MALEILGCRLDPVDANEAVTRILGLARGASGAQVVTLGTEMVVNAQDDARFRAVVNGCALSLCDTVGLLAVARWRRAALHTRVTGVELVEALCAAAASSELPVYFLGGGPGVADETASILRRRYPGLRVAGTHDGYFPDERSTEIAQSIAHSGARLLFAAMGSPRQEFWLAEHLRATGCGAGIGVGGSFDVISGRVSRAPVLARRLGLEWLFRLFKEPRRWRRQLALPRFAWLVLRDELGNGARRKHVVLP